jgi:hypothetical protein
MFGRDKMMTAKKRSTSVLWYKTFLNVSFGVLYLVSPGSRFFSLLEDRERETDTSRGVNRLLIRCDVGVESWSLYCPKSFKCGNWLGVHSHRFVERLCE